MRSEATRISLPLYPGTAGSRVERAVRWSAGRGVDVRVLVARTSDPPGRKLHAKSVAIDDYWSIIGSTNLDRWSLIINHELDLVARDERLASELRQAFLEDTENWTMRGWRERLLETSGWMERKVR